jgi:hypothetical protein
MIETTPENRAGCASLLSQSLSDYGNAQRLLRVYGGNLRYCPPMKRWLIYDGARFRIDERDEIRKREPTRRRRDRSSRAPSSRSGAARSHSKARTPRGLAAELSARLLPPTADHLVLANLSQAGFYRKARQEAIQTKARADGCFVWGQKISRLATRLLRAGE